MTTSHPLLATGFFIYFTVHQTVLGDLGHSLQLLLLRTCFSHGLTEFYRVAPGVIFL